MAPAAPASWGGRCNLSRHAARPCGDTHRWRKGMTTFDDREKAYERKFALDQDLKFRAESRRNRLVAEWAAAKLGIMGAALQDYVRSVVKADLEEKGDED